VLASRNCLSCGRDMELIRDSYDYRFNLGISEQFVVSAIGHLRFPKLGHSVSQVIRSIANGIQSRVSSSLAALEMSGLGDHPTSKDADSNRVRGLFHMISKKNAAGNH
jgi:hypothetical protein